MLPVIEDTKQNHYTPMQNRFVVSYIDPTTGNQTLVRSFWPYDTLTLTGTKCLRDLKVGMTGRLGYIAKSDGPGHHTFEECEFDC